MCVCVCVCVRACACVCVWTVHVLADITITFDGTADISEHQRCARTPTMCQNTKQTPVCIIIVCSATSKQLHKDTCGPSAKNRDDDERGAFIAGSRD